MDVLNLAQIKKNIPKTIYLLAQKLVRNNHVRELEQPTPLHFTAFVDVQKQSHDIKITIDEHQNIQQYSCDCTSKEELCEHVIAVYLSLNKKPKKTAIKILPKKKVEDEVRPLLSSKTLLQKKDKILPTPATPSLDDLDIEEYKRNLAAQSNEIAAKNWRRNFLNTLIRKRKLSNKYTLFLFDLLLFENDLDELIELVDDLTSFELIIKHFDIMYAKDKIQLLKNILSKANTVLYEKRKMIYTDKTFIERMLVLIIKKYTKEEIRVVIQSLKFLYRSSELRWTIDNKLFPKEPTI